MNRYDNEKVIISDFQMFSVFNTKFFPNYLKTFSIFNSIHREKQWKHWVDSSAKSKLPPDFYNDKLKLMMDVMRIDDHAHVDNNGKIVNPYNQRESNLIKELIQRNKSIKEIAEKGNLFVIPYTGLKSEDDHNYNFYINNFKRVLNKHIKKINNYKNNHAGYKIIFFIVDESTPYAKIIDKAKIRKAREKVRAEIHYWWLDKNMIDVIKDSKIDYIIWMAPFKNIRFANKLRKPKLYKTVIYDVKKIKYDGLVVYEPSEMQSLEL